MGRFDENAVDLNTVVDKYVPKKFPKLEKTHEEKIILDRYKNWIDKDEIPQDVVNSITGEMNKVARTIDYRNK